MELKQGSCAHARTQQVVAWSKFVRYSQQSLTLGAAALLTINGELSAGAMIAANVLMTRALTPIDQIASSWLGFISASAAFCRLEALMQRSLGQRSTISTSPPQGNLELRNVVASAEGRSAPILQGIDLSVPQGSVLIVLGASGSGKSTLGRVIMGIWPNVRGDVLLNGVPLAEWNRIELGPHVGYLPQEIELFDGTLAENIARFGKVDSSKVIEAATYAGLHEMILRFPKGYDTPIGESGSMLSGGQRQRVGLARALYGFPSLIVLDEPNSNLDDIGEVALAKAVQCMKEKGKTVVLITHRPNIIAVATSLLVLKNGQIFAQGPRDEVLAALRSGVRSSNVTTTSASAHAMVLSA